MKIAHAQLHMYTNIMYKFQSSTCKTVREKLRKKLCLRTDGQPWRFQYTPPLRFGGYKISDTAEYLVCPPFTVNTARQRRLMLQISFLMTCSGITTLSACKARSRSRMLSTSWRSLSLFQHIFPHINHKMMK